VHVVTALECALLDLLGNSSMCRWCRCLAKPAAQTVDVLGYLFYVGDRRKTNLPLISVLLMLNTLGYVSS